MLIVKQFALLDPEAALLQYHADIVQLVVELNQVDKISLDNIIISPDELNPGNEHALQHEGCHKQGHNQ